MTSSVLGTGVHPTSCQVPRGICDRVGNSGLLQCFYTTGDACVQEAFTGNELVRIIHPPQGVKHQVPKMAANLSNSAKKGCRLITSWSVRDDYPYDYSYKFKDKPEWTEDDCQSSSIEFDRDEDWDEDKPGPYKFGGWPDPLNSGENDCWPITCDECGEDMVYVCSVQYYGLNPYDDHLMLLMCDRHDEKIFTSYGSYST